MAADTACVIACIVLFCEILHDVDSKRPPQQQRSFLDVSVRGLAINSEHARLFAQRHKDKTNELVGRTGIRAVSVLSPKMANGFMAGVNSGDWMWQTEMMLLVGERDNDLSRP